MNNYDCIIIGSGVAGMTASLYLTRANMHILLLEREMPGGKLNKTSDIENYPGFEKINGTDLAMSIFNQIKQYNIDYRVENVIDIQVFKEMKIVTTNKEKYYAKNIILATGRIERKLNLENEDELIGHGISYCAICDGMFFKGKNVAVLGGGDSALTGALYLTNIASKVYIINRSDKLRASDILKERIKNKHNIEVLYNSKVTKINKENDKLKNIEVNNKVLDVDGLFIYIGSDPDISYLKNLNIKNNNGYLIVDSNMQTSVEGIYACGDIILKNVYQITTAIGEASIAANNIKK